MDALAVKGRKIHVCASVAAPPVTVLEKILFLTSIPVCELALIDKQLIELLPIEVLTPKRFIVL
jgi:hypothetical protein